MKLSNLKLVGLVFCLGCQSEPKTVELGPQTNERIQRGEAAQKKLSAIEQTQKEQKEIEAEAVRLEEELAGWIEKSGSATVISGRTVGKILQDNGTCILEISTDGPVNANEIPFLMDSVKSSSSDSNDCSTITVAADRVIVGEGDTLSSRGRNLIIIADVIEIYGTITTAGLDVAANKPGNDGGDLKIFALSVKTGPGAKLVTAGSRAGAFDPKPLRLSDDKIAQLRREAIKNGVRFHEKEGKVRVLQFTDAPSVEVARAYNNIQESALEFLSMKHPETNVALPNPFAGKNQMRKITTRKYWWRVELTPIEVSPIATEDLKIVVPAIDPDTTIPGGKPGNVWIRIASANNLAQAPNHDMNNGAESRPNGEVKAVWDLRSLQKPLEIVSKDRNLYTFELWSRPHNSDEKKYFKREKHWNVSVNAQVEKEKLSPKIVYEIRKTSSQSSQKEVFVERASENSSTQNKPSVTFDFEQGAVSFVEDALKVSGVSTSDLPQGMKKYLAWQSDWRELESRAKRSGMRLERHPQ